MRTHSPTSGLPHRGGPARVRRGLAATAVAAMLSAGAAACGDETGDTEPTASDASTSATATSSASDQPSTSATASSSPTESPTESPSAAAGDPVPSPVITKAVKAALRAGFPALVPAGVPADWTVVDAAYSGKRGGQWRIELTDPAGAPVTLEQSAQELEAFVAATLGVEMSATGEVDLGEYGTGSWAVYTGGEVAGASTALVTSIAGTSVAVSGPDQDTVVALAELLLTAEDGGSGSGDG